MVSNYQYETSQPGTVCFQISLFFNKTEFRTLKLIYFRFQIPNKQMMVLF